MKRATLAAFVALCSASFAATSADSTKHWVGTWGAAPYLVEAGNMPPSPGLTNNTIRQIVRVSIGGDTVRLKLTNVNNTQAVTLKAVTLAVSKGGSAIDAATLITLKFNGSATTTMNAGASVTSDVVAFTLTPSMRVAISVNYGATASNMTGHVASRGPSYLIAGDKTTAADLAGSTETLHWYSISNLDVLAPLSAGAVGIIGNSITDGFGITDGKQTRWTDMFSESLLRNPATKEVAVLNMGIGATNVLGTALTAGVVRFQRDILEQAGVKWAIIYHGVNDIGGNASAPNLINGLKTMVTAAKAKNLKVYCATIIPFNGNAYYTPAHEKVRSDVNAWIRSGVGFDGVIDFDKTMRDPADTTKMKAALKNDWLHPNIEGYKVMGESIDVKLFETAGTEIESKKTNSHFAPAGKRNPALDIRNGAVLVDDDGHNATGQAIPLKR